MKQIWHLYTYDFKNVRSYTFTATYAFMVRRNDDFAASISGNSVAGDMNS